ncbi:hypothetical protein ONZ43_g808 [Nemania bipapillata]|uniref:Uncharacterized protein n=1 Tax=Nemania bipapillata TaxID=110536 RepID=A0ACC2J6X4_9PEZI|nr:hypothetical protein ONZ43_g808 [Nemania bipapillata]
MVDVDENFTDDDVECTELDDAEDVEIGIDFETDVEVDFGIDFEVDFGIDFEVDVGIDFDFEVDVGIDFDFEVDVEIDIPIDVENVVGILEVVDTSLDGTELRESETRRSLAPAARALLKYELILAWALIGQASTVVVVAVVVTSHPLVVTVDVSQVTELLRTGELVTERT